MFTKNIYLIQSSVNKFVYTTNTKSQIIDMCIYYVNIEMIKDRIHSMSNSMILDDPEIIYIHMVKF